MIHPVASTPVSPRGALLRFGAGTTAGDEQKIRELSAQHPVMKTFFDLIDIPTPTRQPDPRFAPVVAAQMEKMQQYVTDTLKAIGVKDIRLEPNGSLVVRIPGSPGLEKARPLMLTAHLDMVAGDPNDPAKKVTPTFIRRDGREFIATDGTTTLGSDDKGGVAMILNTVARLYGHEGVPAVTPAQPGWGERFKALGWVKKLAEKPALAKVVHAVADLLDRLSALRPSKTATEAAPKLAPLPHVPLEIIFSPDEESSCESLKTLDTSQFKARHVLVVDEFAVFKVTTGLASSVQIDIDVSGIEGGHSGENIAGAGPVNAILVAQALANRIGTGMQVAHPTIPNMPLLSWNVGLISGGSAYNAIPETARIGILMRSFDKKAQDEAIAKIRSIVSQAQAEFRRTYNPWRPNNQLQIDMAVHEEYPAWQGDPESPIPGWGKQAAANLPEKPAVDVGPVHAAAQASILALKQNAYGEQFDAALIGPHIEEAHTRRERMDWQSLVAANRWLEQWIKVYTEAQQKALQ